ncbi:MAG: hypothetical protein ACI9T9_001073 [Oleiphilaceae bacterium]|jgi:hypothetical protein
MQVLPINIVSMPSSASSSSIGGTSSSSRDIASSRLVPSVTVSLSNSNKAKALTNIAVPPVYSRVSVGASTSDQLSPSRNAIERPIAGVSSEPADVSSEQETAPELDFAGRSVSDNPAQETEEGSTGEQGAVEPVDGDQARAPIEQTKSQQPPSGQLTAEQLEVVQALQSRDREVRAHEQAHKSVGGSLAGAVSYSYQSAPNGQRYAVGGEVPIDASAVSGDPAATIRKMTTVKAAATAPVDPSAQDLSVAAAASRVLAQARKDLTAENIANQRQQVSDVAGNDTSKNADESASTGAEVRTNFKSEYEDVIAPLESKSVGIDEMA